MVSSLLIVVSDGDINHTNGFCPTVFCYKTSLIYTFSSAAIEMAMLPPSVLILDLGGVLFSWSPRTSTSISPKTLRDIMNCATWGDYECGRITKEECYTRAGEEFVCTPAEVASAFEQARESLQPTEQLVSLIKELRSRTDGTLRVYAMSNIAAPDFEYLCSTKHVDWSVFDHVFTSAAAGQRKPNLGFYRHVIAQGGFDPTRAVFIDDKIENVLSARSLGFQGIIFDNVTNLSRRLHNICGDPIRRGLAYLHENTGKLDSVTDTGIVIKENFAQLLILELTRDPSVSIILETDHRCLMCSIYRTLVPALSVPARTWNFFCTGTRCLILGIFFLN